MLPTSANICPTNTSQMLSLEALCEELSISLATGKNWLKLGKLQPDYQENQRFYFQDSTVTMLKEHLASTSGTALKSVATNNTFPETNYISPISVRNRQIPKQFDN